MNTRGTVAAGVRKRAARTATAARRQMADDVFKVEVWDRFVRFFHWSLVVLLLALVVSAHMGQQEMHVAFGTSLAALVLVRLAWGVIGPEHARFESFVTGPRAALRYLAEIGRGHPRRYLGHNPAGAWMVLALLATVLGLLLTGLALQATIEFDGPLTAVLSGIDDRQVHALVVFHEAALYALYILVPLHLLGVLLASRQHRENLVRAMFTGEKPITTER
jgi:cytochrome b